MQLQDLPRIDRRAFTPRSIAARPCIVVGNTDGWKALYTWDAAYLRTVAGGTSVQARRVQGPPTNIYHRQEQSRLLFGEFMAWIESTAAMLASTAAAHADLPAMLDAVANHPFEHAYYLDWPLGLLSKQLLQDLTIPKWYSSPPQSTFFWCGVLGSSSGLHFDIQPNCNVQVVGRKHFILFPPSESSKLYPTNGGAYKCRFDPNAPDFDQFPLAGRTRGVQGTLNAGESLYIPPGWYHQVTVVSAWAVNVNFWWKTPIVQAITTPVLRRFLLQKAIERHLKPARHAAAA